MWRAAVLLVCIPFWTLAQDGGTVQGTVTNSATHAGLSGVAVTLWTQQAVHYDTTTDGSGNWRIAGVQPGRYYSRFEKTGFIESPTPSPEAALGVGAGATPIQLDAELIPLATLRGRVLDPEGKPAAHVEVESRMFASAETGADGQFAFTGLRPGSYLLRAKPKPGSEPPPGEHGIETVPTYYPSAIDRDDAAPIVVHAGDDLSGFEIRLRTSPVYRVRGIVLDQSGKPLPNANVQLFWRSREQVLGGQMVIGAPVSVRYFFGSPGLQQEEASTFSRIDGTFEFSSVRPGEWLLSAETDPKHDSAQHLVIARANSVGAKVTDHDLADLELRFPEMFTLQATVDWGGAPPPKLDPRSPLMLLLIPADGHGPSIPRIPAGTGNSFRLENVAAGRYRIVPMPGFAPGYYPASLLLDGRDVLGQTVDLSSATAPLRILYRPNAATIRGIVENGEGATVLFWPQSTPLDLIRAIPAGKGGIFEIANVAPGDYYLLAIDRQNLETQPETVIGTFPTLATPVHVEEAGSASVSLSLTHVAE